jgi:membrane peptidoglycan carboxypeptidase
VKNIILSDSEQSLLRKYKELIVSYYIEHNYSKIDIVNEYLNRVSY